MMPWPMWIDDLAWAYLSLSFLCLLAILVDEVRHPQKMAVMNLVWPVTALYFGPVAWEVYIRSGRKGTKARHARLMAEIKRELEEERRVRGRLEPPGEGEGEGQATPEQVAVGVSHCGAGCTLGDIVAEWWVFLMGLTFAGGVFETRLVVDFLLAWAIGIAFQYFSIVPMRGLSAGKGIVQAVKVDTLSIVAFQVGMSAWMALTYYVLFPRPHLEPNDAVFWFMMQVAMIVGYFAAYPVNRYLLNAGWKEKMPQYKAEMKLKMRRQMIEQQKAA
jgi:hypothetical protein